MSPVTRIILLSVLLMAWPLLGCAPTPTSVSSETLGSVDIAIATGQGPERIVELFFGESATPRYDFEFLDGDEHIGLLNIDRFRRARCGGQQLSQSNHLLYRNDILIGRGRQLFSKIDDGPERVDTFDYDGRRSRRVRPDVTRHDTLAPLPLSEGLSAMVTEARVDGSPLYPYEIRCTRFGGGGDPATALVTLPLLPLALLIPADNAGRENARNAGVELYDLVVVGQNFPANFESLARDRHVRYRAHSDASGGYQVVTWDVGGSPTRGIAQPRDVALAGVRHGQVEWKSIDEDSTWFGSMLCTAADGRRGRARPGCSSTGFYQP